MKFPFAPLSLLRWRAWKEKKSTMFCAVTFNIYSPVITTLAPLWGENLLAKQGLPHQELKRCFWKQGLRGKVHLFLGPTTAALAFLEQELLPKAGAYAWTGLTKGTREPDIPHLAPLCKCFLPLQLDWTRLLQLSKDTTVSEWRGCCSVCGKCIFTIVARCIVLLLCVHIDKLLAYVYKPML